MHKLKVIVSTFALALFLSGTAKADLLGLSSSFPDITSLFIGVSYDAGFDHFLATGTATLYAPDGNVANNQDIFNGFFGIDATIDDTGTPLSGDLTINGAFSNTPAFPLLHGIIDQVGFQNPPGGTLFEFTFDVDGGGLAPLFGPKVGVILDAGTWDTAFDGTWANSLGNDGLGDSRSDTFPVRIPSPSSSILGLMGGTMLLMLRRRQQVCAMAQI